jgi:AraC-like DNA-binding protein
LDLDTPADEATITLIAERLASEPDAHLHLPLPRDPRARQIAASIMSDPALSVDDCLRNVNASRRTLERRFKTETGMSLGQWRRRARILAAVAMLAQGESVTRTALTVGYATPSSFVSAFRSELGSPPREFMRR